MDRRPEQPPEDHHRPHDLDEAVGDYEGDDRPVRGYPIFGVREDDHRRGRKGYVQQVNLETSRNKENESKRSETNRTRSETIEPS